MFLKQSIQRLGATAVLLTAAQAAPLGTAITYQGQLKQSGVPYGGTADLRLTLYDAVSGGAVVAGPVTLTNVSVVTGLFTVQVDFGSGAFGGDARWMLIEVRTPAGSGGYVALSPRQAVTNAPQASFAARPWVTSGSTISYTAGRVGIGTSTPGNPLAVVAGAGEWAIWANAASGGTGVVAGSAGGANARGVYGAVGAGGYCGTSGDHTGSGFYGLLGTAAEGVYAPPPASASMGSPAATTAYRASPTAASASMALPTSAPACGARAPT